MWAWSSVKLLVVISNETLHVLPLHNSHNIFTGLRMSTRDTSSKYIPTRTCNTTYSFFVSRNSFHRCYFLLQYDAIRPTCIYSMGTPVLPLSIVHLNEQTCYHLLQSPPAIVIRTICIYIYIYIAAYVM